MTAGHWQAVTGTPDNDTTGLASSLNTDQENRADVFACTLSFRILISFVHEAGSKATHLIRLVSIQRLESLSEGLCLVA